MSKKTEEEYVNDLFSIFTSSEKKKIAWRELYKKNYEFLYRYLFNIVRDSDICKDTIHDSWLAVIDKKIKPKNPRLFRFYLLSTTRNILLNKIRSTRYVTLAGEEAEIEDKSGDILKKILDSEKREYFLKIVSETLSKYSDDKRKIISTYINDPGELSKIVEKFKDSYSRANVYKIIERFRKDLKKKVKY